MTPDGDTPIGDITATPKPGSHEDFVDNFFSFDHLPEHLGAVSEPFHHLAKTIASRASAPTAGPLSHAETRVALRKLLEAKDAAVRTVVAIEAAA